MTSEDKMVLPYNRTGVVIDWDGNELAQFENGMAPSMVSQAADAEQSLIACKNLQGDAVTIFDLEQNCKVAEIAYPFDKEEDIVIRFDKQQNIYIADQAGIHRASMAGLPNQGFTTIVDSQATTIGMNASCIQGMEIDQKGTIWCVVQNFNTGNLNFFRYFIWKRI